jgi:hypothetical protein
MKKQKLISTDVPNLVKSEETGIVLNTNKSALHAAKELKSKINSEKQQLGKIDMLEKKLADIEILLTKIFGGNDDNR